MKKFHVFDLYLVSVQLLNKFVIVCLQSHLKVRFSCSQPKNSIEPLNIFACVRDVTLLEIKSKECKTFDGQYPASETCVGIGSNSLLLAILSYMLQLWKFWSFVVVVMVAEPLILIVTEADEKKIKKCLVNLQMPLETIFLIKIEQKKKERMLFFFV